MHLRLSPPIALLAALALAPFEARAALGETVSAEDAAGTEAVRVKGDAKALELDVHQARLADVLIALARFNIRYRYRSPMTLNDVIDGTYAGPLGHVLSRLFAGYNYAIKQGDAEIDVIIVSRQGEQAIPAPVIVQRRGSGE
jgi:hypothetical protein